MTKESGFNREGVVTVLLKEIWPHSNTWRFVDPKTGISCVVKMTWLAVAQHVPVDEPTITLHLTKGTPGISVFANNSLAAF